MKKKLFLFLAFISIFLNGIAQYKEVPVRMKTITTPFIEKYYPGQLIRIADTAHIWQLTHNTLAGQSMKTVFDSGWYIQVDFPLSSVYDTLPKYIVSIQSDENQTAVKYPREALLSGVQVVADTAGWDTLCTGLTVYSLYDNTMWEHRPRYDDLGNQIGCEWVDVSTRPIIPNPSVWTSTNDEVQFKNITGIKPLLPVMFDTTGQEWRIKLDTNTHVATKYYVDSIFLRKLDTINNPWQFRDNFVTLRHINDSVGIGTDIPTAKFESTEDIIVSGIRFGNGGNKYQNAGINIVIGNNSLNTSSIGSENIAIGHNCLTNYGAYWNTAIGNNVLGKNTSYGWGNTGIGYNALRDNTEGLENTAIGSYAMVWNTKGKRNFALGARALPSNILGDNNVALGYEAGNSTVGSNGIYIGYGSGYYETGSNKLYIHNQPSDSLSATFYADMKDTRIGETPRIRLNGEVMIKEAPVVPGNAAYALTVQDITPGVSRIVQQEIGDCPETVAEVLSDTTSIGKSIGSIQLRITASDTSAWMVIRTSGSKTARWKKLTP